MKVMKDKRSPGIAVAKGLLVVAVILSALWSVQVMSSAFVRVCADRQSASGNRARAEQLYRISETIDPQNWRAPLGLGQILSFHRYYELDPAEKMKCAQRERDTFARAYRHNTKKEEVVYGLGRAELACGNQEEGLNYLRQAAQYKRFNDFYWRKLGIELRKAGHYKEAQDAFVHAQKLDRSDATVKRNIQWLKERVGVGE
jgi:Flp pilus assembly protein TadD